MAVESMFSYAYLYRFHGANYFADRAELAAFNAFPAALSPDCKHLPRLYAMCLTNMMILGWSHQYVTQTNQPWSRNLTGNPFGNVVSYSNTFGLEPNFVSLLKPQPYLLLIHHSPAARSITRKRIPSTSPRRLPRKTRTVSCMFFLALSRLILRSAERRSQVSASNISHYSLDVRF